MKQYATGRMVQLTTEGRIQFTHRLPPTRTVDLLVTRAEGVFLWIKLAIDEISLLETVVSYEELESLIAKLPADLEDFYRQTVSRIPDDSRFRAYALLEIVSRSPELVNLEDLFLAAECASGNTYQECERLLNSARARTKSSSDRHEQPNNDLLNLCGGLLECVAGPETTTVVQFIHRTVRDFVSSTEFPQMILGDVHKLQSENGFTFLMKYRCVSGDPDERQNPDYDLLFLAHEVESSTGRPLTTFVESLPPSFFIQTEPTIEDTFMADGYTSKFIFGVLADLRLLVGEWLDDSEPRRLAAAGAYPINKVAWAAARRSKAPGLDNSQMSGINLTPMAEVLLDSRFSIGDKYFGLTPFETLFCMAFEGLGGGGGSRLSDEMIEMAQLLIERGGQNPSPKVASRGYRYRRSGKYYWTGEPQPLWSALHVSHGPMAKMLLENKADPNVPDYKGNTALDVCIGTEGNVYEIGEHQRAEETFETAMTILSHGGRLSQRGLKMVTTFLKIMEEHGFGHEIADTLRTQQPLDHPVSTENFHINEDFLYDYRSLTSSSESVEGSEGKPVQSQSASRHQVVNIRDQNPEMAQPRLSKREVVKGKIRKFFTR